MAASCDAKDTDVNIRLLEQQDEKAAMGLIWNRIWIKTTFDIIIDKVTSYSILGLSLGLGIMGYFQYYSIVHGIVLSLIIPALIFVGLRFIVLPIESLKNPDFNNGLYEHWSKNELGRYMWVAEIDGAVVGTAALDMISPNTGEVFRVAVSKRHTGKGIGRKLMTTLLMTCRSRGYEHVVLGTSYIQKPAHNLYLKQGFRLVNKKNYGLPPWTFLSVELYLFQLCLDK